MTLDANIVPMLTDRASDEHTSLQPTDHASFFEALNAPPAPTNRLQAAFLRQCETIASR